MRPRLLAGLFGLAWLGADPDRVELRYEPAEGTVLRRTFESQAAFFLDELVLLVDGEEPEHGVPDEIPDLSWQGYERIVLLDEIEAIEDGLPTLLRRTFEEITDETRLIPEEGDEIASTQVSDLEGETVVFVWDGEGYELELEDGDGLDDETIADLAEDVDFRGVLPGEEVEVGDSWEVDVDVYAILMWPGGYLSTYDEDGEPDEAQRELALGMLEELVGEGSATLEEVRDEDGTRIAVLALSFEAESAAEVEIDAEGVGISAAWRGAALERSLEGELLWDLDEGRIHSLEMAAEAEQELRSRYAVEGPEGEVEIEETQVFSGEITYELEVEPQ